MIVIVVKIAAETTTAKNTEVEKEKETGTKRGKEGGPAATTATAITKKAPATTTAEQTEGAFPVMRRAATPQRNRRRQVHPKQ